MERERKREPIMKNTDEDDQLAELLDEEPLMKEAEIEFDRLVPKEDGYDALISKVDGEEMQANLSVRFKKLKSLRICPYCGADAVWMKIGHTGPFCWACNKKVVGR